MSTAVFVLIYFVIPIVVIIVCLGLFVHTRPTEFRIERNAIIDAPPITVFPLVDNLHTWARWSPFEKLDLNMKKTFDGPPDGVGAISAWDGNSKAGSGRMTILESAPNDLIKIKLEFFRPFAATNLATFTFEPSGAGTRVAWIMEGQKNFQMKFFHLLINMEKMLGPVFLEGLENLNRLAQAEKQTTS